MADVSKININGTSYNIKDITARTNKADKATTLAGYGISNAYTKAEVNNMLAEKAGLNAYENVVRLSNAISLPEQLNSCSDTNKTYVFNIIPPLATNLVISVGCACIVNNYDNYIQILKPVRYDGRMFIREYNSSTNSWSNFVDITIPNNYINKTKLSADLRTEIEGKYNSSNIESGQGDFTYDESINLSYGHFFYQRVGKIVTVTVKITAGEDIAAGTLTLSGLPYINKITGVYLKAWSTKNYDRGIQIPYNTGQIKVISSLSADESLILSFTYQISF